MYNNQNNSMSPDIYCNTGGKFIPNINRKLFIMFVRSQIEQDF